MIGASKQMGSFWNSDMAYSLRQSKLTIVAIVVLAIAVFFSFFAPWFTPHDPSNLGALNLSDSLLPPAWINGGEQTYFLGTDDQGRDVLSAILYGTRISLIVGVVSVLLSMAIGIALGLLSGYVGGKLDAFIMSVADVQLSFPSILIALLIDGVARTALPKGVLENVSYLVVILAIALSGWVKYARMVRSLTMVEKNKEYVQAAYVIGVHPVKVMLTHVLPNVTGTVFVLATLHIGLAIMIEATLSFLGMGMPSTSPSLGTLISTGNQFLFSGEWWISMFPGAVLVMLILAVNLLGDWLRDFYNPKLQ